MRGGHGTGDPWFRRRAVLDGGTVDDSACYGDHQPVGIEHRLLR